MGRQSRYRKEKRKAWSRFIGIIALFAIPFSIILLVLYQIVPSEQQPHLLVLSHVHRANSAIASDKIAVDPVSISKNGEAVNVSLPKEKTIIFGGGSGDAALMYFQFLADAPVDQNGESEPLLFVPRDTDEFFGEEYVGLLERGDDDQPRWVPAETFLKSVIQFAADQADGAKKKLILLLDLRHPNLVCSLPPEENQFVASFRKRWENGLKDSLGQIADVCLVLSHSENQHSYLGTDPQNVQTLFQFRLAKVLAGDETLFTGDKIKASRFFDYLSKEISSDAKMLHLRQDPLVLASDKFGDFDLFSTRPTNNTSPFVAKKRTADGARLLKSRWSEISQRKWLLENPLKLQLACMYLAQAEKLWYRGLENSPNYDRLLDRTGVLLKDVNEIAPAPHSLYDQAGHDQVASTFNVDWLDPLPEGESPEATAEAQKRRKKAIQTWVNTSRNWQGSYEVWQALVSLDRINRDQLVEAFQLLANSETYETKWKEDPRVSPSLGVQWTEVAWINRLLTELPWDNTETFFQIVSRSCKARDLANRFQENLERVLVNEYAGPFQELETRRRNLEDRLFAKTLKTLRGQQSYDELLEDYIQLTETHDRHREQVKLAHQTLLLLPYLAGNSITKVDSEKLDQWTELAKKSISDLRPKAGQGNEFEIPEMFPAELFPESFVSAGISPGNLIRRRLVGIPFVLTPRMYNKEEMYEVLSDPENQIAMEGEAPDAWQESETESKLASKIGTRLQEILRRPGAPILDLDQELPFSDGLELTKDKSNFFALLTANAHMLHLNSRNAHESILARLHQHQAQLSELAFQRVADDLWATPESNGQFFVVQSLRGHRNFIKSEVRKNEDSLPESTAMAWSRYSDSDSSIEASFAKSVQFANSFERGWAQDEKESGLLIPPEPLKESVAHTSQKGNEMVLSIRTNANNPQARMVPSTAYVSEEQKWNYESAELPNQARLNIYFRGHLGMLEVKEEAPVEITAVSTKLKSDHDISRMRINQTAMEEPIGEILFVLDCSGSMNDSVTFQEGEQKNTSKRIERLKRSLTEFLEYAAERKNIKVSMFAIGRTLKRLESDEDEPDKTLYEKQPIPDGWRGSPDVNLGANSDILEFWLNNDDKGGILSDSTIKGRANTTIQQANLNEYLEAIKVLKPIGETPILAGLNLALSKTVNNRKSLIVLLTDGFELVGGKDSACPIAGVQSFDAEAFQNVKRSLVPGEKQIVVFNFALKDSSDTIRQAFNKYMFDVYKTGENPEDVRREFNNKRLTDITARINDINSLDKFENVNRNNLSDFLLSILPVPRLEVRGSASVNLPAKELELAGVETKPMDLMSDLDDEPNWNLRVKYPQKNVIPIFSKDSLEWNSDKIPLKGSENLTFEFNPINQELRLTTEVIVTTDEEIRTGVLSNQEQKIVLTSDPLSDQDPRLNPRFSFWAIEDNQLTRAPDLVFARFQNENGKWFLLQDFILIPQTRSNLHELKLATIPKPIRQYVLGKGVSNLELIMIESTTPEASAWRKVRFNNDDGRELSNGQAKKRIGEVQKVGLSGEGISQPMITWENDSSKAATDPRIEVSRKLDNGKVVYTISVMANDPQQWVVQVLDENDRIPRMSGLISFERVYQLGKRGDREDREITRIDHVFEFESAPDSSQPLFFSFARLSDLIDGEQQGVSRVIFEEYFK